MKKVVWLASWYPNEADPFTGDFIQRHARATAPFQPLELLFIGKKSEQPKTPANKPEQVVGLKETLLYYDARPGQGKISTWFSARSYFRSFQNWFTVYRKANGLPDLIHVHVAMRAGMIALYLKKRYGIPYVLTEHWSAYFINSVSPLADKGRMYRFLVKKILRNAGLLMPVSGNLGRQMTATFGPLPLRVIPNVVDTRYFFLKTNWSPVFRFIHVSSMAPFKNAAGILRAFGSLIDGGADAELVMVGPRFPVDRLSPAVREKIRFTGEIAYQSVADELRKATAFVLFSERENQPCVILESLCCGVPVIGTRTGGIPEIINDSNGVLVDAGDEAALGVAMRTMLESYVKYNPAEMAEEAQRLFRYDTIGKAYAKCYTGVFK